MTSATITTSTPRIYVASLSDYNAGILHGAWIDATADDLAEQVEAMLGNSPTARRDGCPAEEYAIHDHDGFCGLRVGEYDSLDSVAALAAALADAGEAEALAAFVDAGHDLDEFEDAYWGRWSSVEEYAADYIESTGVLADASELVARYFDFTAFARDLVLGGDIWTAPASGGDMYVFASI